ncbi:MAG: YebC/PmpR family DNA-binding transcriptional regulator [bacterium]|nr:YebC/PmpR family DNA-binding transcriptional regulator [bacterium]
MSGHSKWATIKHRKGAADKRRGKLFARLIRQVEVAARAGGGDLDANPTLRTMYQKARDASVPLETIERAIKRGTGELEGVAYEPFTYEGYAPAGVALYVEVLTDNRNRTSSEVRSLFRSYGGSLAEPGAVAWQFRRGGVITVPRTVDEEELMMAALDAGAEDIIDEGDTWRVTCAPTDLPAVAAALAAAGVGVENAESTMLATQVVPVASAEQARAVLRLVSELDDHDDVQDVHANFDIPDEILQDLAASV